MELNKAQKQAAETLSGLVVVDAGAGSGKTRALTQRFVNALDARMQIASWTPTTVDRIVAITFTDKAAGELADRIRETLRTRTELQDQARAVDVAWISTIHGFCSRLLRDNALPAGLDPRFGVADTVTAGELAEQAFETASRAAIGRDPNARRLFGDYGYERVFEAVASIRRELIKRGMPAESLELEPVVDARRLLAEALDVLRAAAADLEACNDSRAKVAARIGQCREVSERLCSLDAGETPASEIGHAVWLELRVLPKSAGLKNGVAAELLADLASQRLRLRREALALALRPLGEALVSLAVESERLFGEAKGERSLLDFDDLQICARGVLAEHPELASAYRELFALVMVDEFQDTDSLQLALVRAVSGPNLCTVGDERQSIYRFRGAEIEVYRRHRDEAMGTGVEPIKFALNYRSHGDVLSFVNRVFGSAEYFDGELLALEHGRKEPETPVLPLGEPRIELLVVDRPGGTTETGREREAAEVAARFAELRDQHGVNPAGMAVLIRSWNKAAIFADALRRQGFAVIVGGGDFLTRPEVLLVRSLMAVVANPQDELALTTVLASPIGGVSATALWVLSTARREQRVGLWDAMLGELEGLGEADRMAVQRVVSAVRNARLRVGSAPLAEIVLRAVTELGYDLVLLSQGLEGKQQFVNVLKVARLAESFEETGQTGVAGFVEHLDAKEKLGDRESIASLADDGSPAVRIMTIHGAKGLEFPVVAMIGLADGSASDRRFIRTGWSDDNERLRIGLKARLSGEDDDVDRTEWFVRMDEAEQRAEVDEEKRLAYVAATRAEEYLLLSGGVQLDKLASSPTMLGRILRSLGATEEFAPGVEEIVDFGGFEARLRCVEAVPVETVQPEASDAATLLTEADLVVEAPAATRRESPSVEDVSFSALKGYLTCPRRFWSERVVRLGWAPVALEELPASDDGGDDEAASMADDPLAFGSAVHGALEEAVEGREPTDERLTAIAAMFGLSEDARGRLARAVGAALGSAAVERARQTGRMRAEVPFSLALGEGEAAVRLGGSIDLYARNEETAVIIDYKTGTWGDSDGVRRSYELQAQCYALAALADGVKSVEALYVRPEVADGHDVETTTFGPFDQSHIPRLESTILEVVGRIRSGEFPPNPSEWACSECAIPRGLCPEAWESS